MNLTHEERQERTDEAWKRYEDYHEHFSRFRVADRAPLPAERPITIPPTPPDWFTQQQKEILETDRQKSRRISSEIIADLKREGRL